MFVQTDSSPRFHPPLTPFHPSLTSHIVTQPHHPHQHHPHHCHHLHPHHWLTHPPLPFFTHSTHCHTAKYDAMYRALLKYHPPWLLGSTLFNINVREGERGPQGRGWVLGRAWAWWATKASITTHDFPIINSKDQRSYDRHSPLIILPWQYCKYIHNIELGLGLNGIVTNHWFAVKSIVFTSVLGNVVAEMQKMGDTGDISLLFF